jgi:hypothetical protein
LTCRPHKTTAAVSSPFSPASTPRRRLNKHDLGPERAPATTTLLGRRDHKCRLSTRCTHRPIGQFCADRRMPPTHTSSRPERKPLCVKRLRRSFSRRVKCSSDAVASPAIHSPWPSSRPSVAVVLPHLQVVRPRFAAGAPPGPAAAPAAGWQRPGEWPALPGARAEPGAGLPAAVVGW